MVGHLRSSNRKNGYSNYREELSVEDGLMFKAHRLVIPTSLRAEYLKDLHAGYLAGEKNSVESTGDCLLVRDLGLCKKCS